MLKVTIISSSGTQKTYDLASFPRAGETVDFRFDGLLGVVDEVIWLHLNEVKLVLK